MRLNRTYLPIATVFVLLCLFATDVRAQGGLNTPPAPPQAIPQAVVSDTLVEFNFDGMPPFPTAPQPVGTFAYTIPVGETITSATVTGQFGNTTVGSTAPIQVFVDGVLVATCLMTDPCFNGPVPWTFSFAAADFPRLADNLAELTVIQTAEFEARLGQTTIVVNSSPPVPTLPQWALIALALALGMYAAVTLRRRGMVSSGG